MICVLMLQNCMCFVESETGSCSETCLTCGVDGTEEISNVEDVIDIKDEMPEAITFPPIKTENEVRLRNECEVAAALAFRPFIAAEEIVKLHLTISSFILYCRCHIPFEIWFAILKRRDVLEILALME